MSIMLDEYLKARKLGQKAFREALSHGKYPYLTALDEVLLHAGNGGEVSLGTTMIPLSMIVGTRTKARAESFAHNFMPLLSERSEFAVKWQHLYESQLEEGIREPVRVYEYMYRFYVQEGNKRVSILKYVGASDIRAEVTRILPKLSDTGKAALYYEYAEFSRATKVFEIQLSRPEAYRALAAFFGETPSAEWSEEHVSDLRASFLRFARAYDACLQQPGAFPAQAGDAFLRYMEIYGPETLLSASDAEIREQVEKARAELLLAQQEEQVALIEEPCETEPQRGRGRLFDLLFMRGAEKPALKIAFINDKTPETSRWTYGHSLGWKALSDKYGDKVEISVQNGCGSPEKTEEALGRAIADGNDLIFTTAGQMQPQVIPAAIEHPEIKFLNCSVNTAYKSIRTYYARMYEAKFVLGAIAAALSGNDEIGYVADYPVYGAVANINAFAVGAQLTNPRAKVHLKWANLKDCDWAGELHAEGADTVLGPDFKVPSEEHGRFGLFRLADGSEGRSLALPVVDWGRYYELIIESVLEGSFYAKELTKRSRAVNYFWGMSSGVVDVFCSKRIPYATRKLSEILKKELRHGDLSPFYGELRAKTGLIKEAGSEPLDAWQIVRMDWLNENIIGEIPPAEAFKEDARIFVENFGVMKKDGTE